MPDPLLGPPTFPLRGTHKRGSVGPSDDTATFPATPHSESPNLTLGGLIGRPPRVRHGAVVSTSRRSTNSALLARASLVSLMAPN